MKLLEYQGKELFKYYGINVPKSYLAKNIEQAKMGSQKIGFPFVLKSQLTVGGRGKAGAILKCKNENELFEKFNELINKEVKGEKPKSILLVEMENVDNKIIIDIPDVEGISSELASQVADKMNLNNSEKNAFIDLIQKLSKLIYEEEAELAEINPLAMINGGELVALDAKVIIDDNALFRHEDIKKYEELSELESQAKNNGFSFVELDGDIAIIGNGAGLVMSTLDMVTDAGGKAG